MNDIKETQIILKKRKYNGDYTVGSVFVDNIEIIVKQLSNNVNKNDGIVVLTIEKKFCCDEKIGDSLLASIKTEIPIIIKYEKLLQFNEIIDKIKNNNDYKYNNSHYTKEKFDPNRFNYLDLIIDNEQFEIHNNDVLYKKLFQDILEIEHFNKSINEDYQNIKEKIIKKEDNLKEYLILMDKKIEEIENEINNISNESNYNKSDLEHTVDNLHNMINELDNYNLDIKNNNYQTTGETVKLQIEEIKIKAKKMYNEINPELNKIVKEYLEECQNMRNSIISMTTHFMSKIHSLKGYDKNEKILKYEKLDTNTLSSIIGIEDKYVSELIPILNTIYRYKNVYDNTINRVIPEIAKQIELKTHENGVINYIYSNLYDKLPNDEITKVIEEIIQKERSE